MSKRFEALDDDARGLDGIIKGLHKENRAGKNRLVEAQKTNDELRAAVYQWQRLNEYKDFQIQARKTKDS